MSAPLITVLINAYNYARFIEQAIDSVLSQHFPLEQVQILVVDDGSTDDTAERVRKYGPQVEYLYKRNGGQGSALNLGFAHAKGEIIALLDADDYFLPGKLSRIAKEYNGHPEVGMIYHGYLNFESESNRLEESRATALSGFLPDDPSTLPKYIPTPTSCLTFRRRFLEPFVPIPESIRLQADAYLTILAAALSPVLGVPEALSTYRVHGHNLYHSQGEQVSAERRQRRIEMLTTIPKEVRVWTMQHKHQTGREEIRRFIDRRLLSMREELFLIAPPGRLRFFRFLLSHNHAYSPIQNWKLTLFNYLFAPFALVLGYNEAQRFYQWRGKLLESIQRSLGKSLPAER